MYVISTANLSRHEAIMFYCYAR